ncbi:carboxymuconolactone decarboxylase family protein [Cryobacterium sp. TMT2-10]|uniref:Carboxymuconolactone decarboxylase family protein n=1 Tax=Cryobacterium shii TaxID=1259235 RepID=A0AAQ2C8V0_9MICO|nr:MULTISPECIES: carboxymuconolactone decarboxylase family protein [Cryobacterium]TFC51727.1 carboxymuconolactone decarboxylase family protein [Cryobacterium shii]TFC89405.1 carboxymuconolactone decarboxylase family protein [Cryobacterium sp. TmT2-59]TFD13694.1 carboxymuconolactone decarboxylase family protein [Cryobacterium sp. TMT4-10]TFD19791.1 carboxymuconolactone decarboxylase family protein [Cryobacterium sp. TMT2-23]TFD43415.1 carboxymuconolactone decarboxylase family protein [Cryobacte
MARGENPVLETMTDINAVSLASTELDDRSLMLVRIAALAATDAPVMSYLLHVGPAEDAGVTVEDVEDVLVAVAPIIGTPRTMAAVGKIAEALGIAIELGSEDTQ